MLRALLSGRAKIVDLATINLFRQLAQNRVKIKKEDRRTGERKTHLLSARQNANQVLSLFRLHNSARVSMNLQERSDLVLTFARVSHVNGESTD